MTISSFLASRLGPGGPTRWSPYARAPDPGHGAGRSSVPPGGGGNSRPPLRVAPATARLLGHPARKGAAAPPGSRCRAEAEAEATAASDAACPNPPRRGCEETNPNPNPKRNPKPAERGEEPPVRAVGCGGFAFLCALAGHTEAISGISLPVGSDKLYSGSADGSVRVWDCNSGKVAGLSALGTPFRLFTHDSIYQGQFASKAMRLCVDAIKMGGKIGCMITHGPWIFVGITKSVEAWNTQTGMKSSLHGPSGLVCSMTIKDEMLFAGTGDGRIMAWKIPDKKGDSGPVAILSGHERQVISLGVSATRLYSGSLDKTIKVWDLKTLQCVQTLSEHKAAVTSVLCWDEKLLSCSLDKTVKIWAASKSGDLQVIYTHSEEHGVRTLFGMHRVGKTPVLFCSLHNSNCIRLFDLPSFDEMGKLFSKKEVRTIELAAGGLLFTGDGAGELKVWRWAPEEEPATPALVKSSM
uniref:Anaphase-promoting complex subunit 4 WD40 domain-containing protein n=1 Tax=Oryza rufipogon TaxID=4529 RepID=A0A0E0MSE7_ORYRU